MTPWMTMIISSLISTVISATITGLIVTRINKKLDIRQQEALDKEKKKDRAISEYNMLMLKGIMGSLSLGEATAEAVETQQYNGKQRQAREYAEGVKHDIQEFLYSQGQEHLK